MDNCIFCKIISHQAPSHRVYEDPDFLAFLTINPVSKGHTLVIPKTHWESLFDLDHGVAGRYFEVIQKLGIHICKKLDCRDFNVVNANGKRAQQSVFHIHFHIVPRFENDGLNLWFHGLQKPGNDELEKVCRLIKVY
jgi:histidine triad (HIT) family protein